MLKCLTNEVRNALSAIVLRISCYYGFKRKQISQLNCLVSFEKHRHFYEWTNEYYFSECMLCAYIENTFLGASAKSIMAFFLLNSLSLVPSFAIISSLSVHNFMYFMFQTWSNNQVKIAMINVYRGKMFRAICSVFPLFSPICPPDSSIARKRKKNRATYRLPGKNDGIGKQHLLRTRRFYREKIDRKL